MNMFAPHPEVRKQAESRAARSPLADDEQSLMAAYAAGDKRAFDQLFALFAPRLLAFFRRSTSHRELAEDMLQLTFERLHKHRDRYQRGMPVRPWLFTIAARVRIDELRRRYRLPRSAEDDELDRLVDHGDAEQLVSESEQLQRAQQVHQALDTLPASQRVIIHLHRFENLTFKEIGEAVGLSEGAARIKAFRAYDKLRVALQPMMAEERHD